MWRPLVHRMIHKADRPGGGSEWTCPFCHHQIIVWPLYRRTMVEGQSNTVHVKDRDEVPTHLDDLVLELTEADVNWLILNSIAWSKPLAA
jgi:hypothetical protein